MCNSGVGVLSNLIGSLSRTILQCSPSREWIMRELGVFQCLWERTFKIGKSTKVDVFEGKTKKTSKISKQRQFIYYSWIFCAIKCLQLMCTVNAFLLFCLYSMCNTKQRSNCSRPFTLTLLLSISKIASTQFVGYNNRYHHNLYAFSIASGSPLFYNNGLKSPG